MVKTIRQMLCRHNLGQTIYVKGGYPIKIFGTYIAENKKFKRCKKCGKLIKLKE